MKAAGRSDANLFKGLKLDYRYLEDGHDVLQLVRLLQSVKDIDHPVVLHIHTVKGKGLPYAEQEAEEWHSGSPFNVVDGTPKNGYPKYDTTVHDSLVALMETNKQAVVLTAGTPRALGFVGEDRAKWAATGQFVDVGIAEESAMAMASGLAKYGGTAVFGVYAPFLQRAYDQLSHDLCLNNNPATILVLPPGVFGMKSNTHLGLCDIQMMTHVPNLVYLAPTCREEYRRMLHCATSQKAHPMAIRVPVRWMDSGTPDETDYTVLNQSKVLQKGTDAALIAVGNLMPLAMETANAYFEQTGRRLTVINPVFLTGVDEALLTRLLSDHRLVITMEDGELDGGYGERVASFYGTTDMKVKNLGISKAFHSDFNAEALLAENGISQEAILALLNEELQGE